MNRSGSVLVEVVALLFVAGLIAAVAIPDYDAQRPEARQRAIIASLKTVRSAIDRYWSDHGATYPTLEALRTLERPERDSGVLENMYNYLRRIPDNPFTEGNRVGHFSSPVGVSDWVYDPTTGVFQANDTEAHRAL